VAGITFDHVTKQFPDGTIAVSDLCLEIRDGEFLVLVGPSGCGKTTALRMIAGLEVVSEGTISIGGQVVNDVHVKQRDIAMVFQNYALYPHMSVRDNMGFGLKMRKVPRREIEARVTEVAHILGLEELLNRKPRALSGGQRQRVAMGRAIVRNPRAFLMDEPLSNLDAKLRIQMRAEISRIQRELSVTTVYVTHDQTEAMTMGDRVAVMRLGELQQVDMPQALYDAPGNLFVAGFIGSPAMNLVEARVVPDGNLLTAEFGEHSVRLSPALLERIPILREYEGKSVVIGFRPEDMEDVALVPGAPADQVITAPIQLVETLGSDVVIHFPVHAPQVQTKTASERALDQDVEALALSEDEAAMFVGRISPRTRARIREPLELFIDTDRAHAFDPESGLTLAPTQ
jgi:multiple sugar transport system ATP-binding protein